MASELEFTGKERDTETGLDYFGADTTGARWELGVSAVKSLALTIQ